MAPATEPITRLARSAVRSAWRVALTAWDTIVWGNVRAGSVSLAGLPRSLRVLIRTGLWLTLGLLLLLLFANTWRVISPLVPLVADTDSLGGLYAPKLLIPLTIGLLALAWAYLVTGGLHSPWWCKLLVLALLALFDTALGVTLLTGSLTDLSLLTQGAGGALWSLAALGVHGLGWLVLLAWFGWRWRRPARPGLEFPVTLLLTMVLFFSSHFGTVLGNATFQTEATASALQLTNTLQVIGVFLTPFLLLSGAEVAEFGMSLTQEATTRLAQQQTGSRKWARRGWLVGLVIFLLWRLVSLWIAPLLGGSFQLGLGALVATLVIWSVFALRRRRPAVGELPAWVVPMAAVTLYAVLFLVQLLGLVETVLAAVALALGQGPNVILQVSNAFFGLVTRGNELMVGSLAIALGLILWGRARLRRRPLPAAALFMWIFGAWLIFWVLTRRGQFLGRLTFAYTDLETVMALSLLVLLVVGVLFRRLSARTLLHLTAAALLLWLLEFQSWLSDPLSPLGGLLGAPGLFVSAGIFLNVLSAGNHFALNSEHAHFPRPSRALLYFGYAILTVTTINWLAATHSANAIAQNSEIAQNGFIAIGLPLAIWALLTGDAELLGEKDRVS
jgi:hypothetical protein